MSVMKTALVLLVLGTLLLPQAVMAEDPYSLMIENRQDMALRLQSSQPTGLTLGSGPSVCDAGMECRWTLELPGTSGDFPGGRSLVINFSGGDGEVEVLIRIGGGMQGASCLPSSVGLTCQGQVDSTGRQVTLTVSSQ